MMRRHNPFVDFEELFERMSRQFDEMSRGWEPWDGGGRDDWTGGTMGRVAIDVADHGDELVVTADLPGFEKSDIDLSVSESILTIHAERESESEHDSESYLHRERRHASVRRSVRLPEAVDETGASASYSNGVLTVTLPKVQVSEDSHRIDID